MSGLDLSRGRDRTTSARLRRCIARRFLATDRRRQRAGVKAELVTIFGHYLARTTTTLGRRCFRGSLVPDGWLTHRVVGVARRYARVGIALAVARRLGLLSGIFLARLALTCPRVPRTTLTLAITFGSTMIVLPAIVGALRIALLTIRPLLIITMGAGALIVTLPRATLATTIVLVAAALLVRTDRIALVAIILVAVEIVLRAAFTIIIVVSATLVGEDAKIMVGELEVIFGVYPIALALRVRRHVLVLFVQLTGIAARTAVDPIAVIA
ncbi:MAG: hypothetical protein K0S66_967 [Sphingomonas sp.]|nr:hypothetical protein [Sphingomonas sp.]